MKAKVREEVFRLIRAKYPGMTIDDIDWDMINLVWHSRDAEVAEAEARGIRKVLEDTAETWHSAPRNKRMATLWQCIEKGMGNKD